MNTVYCTRQTIDCLIWNCANSDSHNYMPLYRRSTDLFEFALESTAAYGNRLLSITLEANDKMHLAYSVQGARHLLQAFRAEE
jgi:hypothetical protein